MLKQLLSQSSYWVINKNITYELGLEASLLLTHLIDCAEKFNQPFYQQKEKIMEYTGLSERSWRRCIKILKDKKILVVEKKGNPAKNYYTLDESEIYKLLNSASTSDAQSAFTRHARNALTRQAQNALTNKVIKESNKNKHIEEANMVVEGGRTPDVSSTTSSTTNKENNTGWQKFVELYPLNKQRDIIEASMIWNSLSQSEKQSVFRHSKAYIQNTEPQFVKQIGKYLQSNIWKNMKSPIKKEVVAYKSTGMIDYNFINWYNKMNEINNWEKANKQFQLLDENSKVELRNKYEQLKKQYERNSIITN